MLSEVKESGYFVTQIFHQGNPCYGVQGFPTELGIPLWITRILLQILEIYAAAY